MRAILSETTAEETVRMVAEVAAADTDLHPVFANLRPLSGLDKPYLRAFWEGQLSHADFDRRAEAVSALADLPADPGTTAKLRALITEKQPIAVVRNAIHALEAWDKKGNRDVFEKALKIPSHHDVIKNAAKNALGD
jgi:hypothetical protein